MITKQMLFDYPLPRRPKRIAPGAEYRVQLQHATIDGTAVQVYTFYKINDGELALYFRTFCWDGTFTTWVYDHGDSWAQAQAAVNRWSNAMVDKFISYYHVYRHDDVYGSTGMLCGEHGGFAGRVDGAKLAERLYQYQAKIRNDALVEKRRRVRMDTEKIMAGLGDPPRDLPAFIDSGPLRDSRYIYYKTIRKRRVKGKAVNTIAGYCTHCKKDFEKDVPGGATLHNASGKCPCCGSAIQYKAAGKASKYLQDDARFAVMQRISHGVVIRGFSVRREYHDHYREPKTEYREYYRIFLTFSGHLSYYHWEWVPSPGTERWRGKGEMQWRRYGKNGFIFPTDAHLYTKNLRYVLKGTPWEYSGIKELARKGQEPFFIEDYLTSYEDHPCLEYLAKLGLTRLILDHLPGHYRSSMGNFHKTDFTQYHSEVVNLWGKSLGEVLPNTDRRDIPLLAKVDASVEMVRIAGIERKAGRPCRLEDLNALREVCREYEAMRNVARALPYVPLGKAVRYLQKLGALQNNRVRAWTISDWADYLEMAAEAGWDMTSKQVLYPEVLKEAHEWARAQLEVKRNARHDAAIAAMAGEYRERFAFEYKGLAIVVPESAGEIIQEGQALHHCVGRYAEDMANGRTVILFIRKAEDPHTPYYTLEVGADNQVRQCRGSRNDDPTPDVMKLLKTFKRQRLALRAAAAS